MLALSAFAGGLYVSPMMCVKHVPVAKEMSLGEKFDASVIARTPERFSFWYRKAARITPAVYDHVMEDEPMARKLPDDISRLNRDEAFGFFGQEIFSHTISACKDPITGKEGTHYGLRQHGNEYKWHRFNLVVKQPTIFSCTPQKRAIAATVVAVMVSTTVGAVYKIIKYISRKLRSDSQIVETADNKEAEVTEKKVKQEKAIMHVNAAAQAKRIVEGAKGSIKQRLAGGVRNAKR